MSENVKFKHLLPPEQYALRQISMQIALQARVDGDTLETVLAKAPQVIDYLLNGGRDVELLESSLADTIAPMPTPEMFPPIPQEPQIITA